MVASNFEVITDRPNSHGKRKQKRRDVCDRNENELTTKNKKNSFKERLKRSFRISRSKSEPIDEVALTRGRKRKLSFLFCSFRKSLSKPKKIVRGLPSDTDDEENCAYQKIPKEIHETDILDDVFDPEISVTSDSSRETIIVENHSKISDDLIGKVELESEQDTESVLTIDVACPLVEDGFINDVTCHSEEETIIDDSASDKIDLQSVQDDSDTLNSEIDIPFVNAKVDIDLQEENVCVTEETEDIVLSNEAACISEKETSSDLLNGVKIVSEGTDGDDLTNDEVNDEIDVDISNKVDSSTTTTTTEKRVAFENDVRNKTDEETRNNDDTTNKTDGQVVVSNSFISSYNIKTRYFLTKLFNIKNYIWRTKNNSSDDKNKMSCSRDATTPADNSSTLQNNQAVCNTAGKDSNDQCRSSIILALNEDGDQKRSSILISLNDGDRNHRHSYLIPLHDASARSSFAFTLDDDIDLSDLIDYANKTFDGGIVYKLDTNTRDLGGSDTNIVENVVSPLFHHNKNYDSGICRSYEMLCTPGRSSIRESLHLGDGEEVIIAEGPDIL